MTKALDTNLAFTGQTAPGGGGVTAFTDLSDADTVDLPTVNAPLAASLEALIEEEAYAIGAVHFDGVNSSLVNAALTATDSHHLAFSMWFKYAVVAEQNKVIWAVDVANMDSPEAKMRAIGVQVTVSDTNYDNSFSVTSNGAPTIDVWHHMLCCIDGALGQAKIYIDDVDVTDSANGSVTVAAFNGLSFNFGEDSWGLGMTADVADVWIDTNRNFIVDGDIEESVRRLFISANRGPVDLGEDGEIPTGTAPTIFFHAEVDDEVDTFQVNRGTGGAFTLVGSLAVADSSPVALEGTAFTDLADTPQAYAGFGNRVPSVKSDESGMHFSEQLYLDPDNGGVEIHGGDDGILLESGPGNLRLTTSDNGFIKLAAASAAIVDLLADGSINLTAASVSINESTTVATQEVLVAGVGTLTFTHGLLTGFTPV